MSELFHECGVAAVYHLSGRGKSPLGPEQGPEEVSRLIPRMLQDIQNRGQLSAGMTSYNPHRNQLLDTHKELGGVGEVFRLSHRGKYESLMRRYAGRAAIGQVRYATCGAEDKSYAQPFERHHVQKHKWFSFAFNGQLANYQELRQRLLDDPDNYLARDTDTEIIMHEIGRELSENNRPSLFEIMRSIATRFDGAYCLVLLNALGDMLVARDPLGLRPLCYALEGPLFAAASESVALVNLGFSPENIKSLLPGQAITIIDGQFEIQSFARSPRGPTASSSGSTLPTWPARWTAVASTCRARRWAKSWPGWKRCRSTKIRSWCPCPTPARPRPTRWPLSSAFPRSKG